MTEPRVNMSEWLNKGWDLVMDDLGLYVLASLIYWVVIGVAFGSYIGGFLVWGPLTVGFYYLIAQKIENKETQLGDLAKGFNFFIAAAISNILITVFVGFGSIFCIIPGIIISAMYIFTPIIILQEDLDFWQAMEKSRKLAWEHGFELVVFTFILGLLNLVGFLLLGLGLLITTPITFAATYYAYQDLTRE